MSLRSSWQPYVDDTKKEHATYPPYTCNNKHNTKFLQSTQPIDIGILYRWHLVIRRVIRRRRRWLFSRRGSLTVIRRGQIFHSCLIPMYGLLSVRRILPVAPNQEPKRFYHHLNIMNDAERKPRAVYIRSIDFSVTSDSSLDFGIPHSNHQKRVHGSNREMRKQ